MHVLCGELLFLPARAKIPLATSVEEDAELGGTVKRECRFIPEGDLL